MQICQVLIIENIQLILDNIKKSNLHEIRLKYPTYIK